MNRSNVRVAVVWGLLACAVGFGLLWRHASKFGSWTALIAVGAESELREVIEPAFEDLALVAGIGHDGMSSYLIAVDPLGKVNTEYLAWPGYRYRRILYPLLAGGFGLLPPGEAVVTGLVVFSLLGFGLATAATALLAAQTGCPKWIPLLIVFNPGLWQGMRVSTSDTLALGLTLAGVALWRNHYVMGAAVLMALAALTKDQYLVTAVGAALFAFVHDKSAREAALLAGLPVAALGGWTLYLTMSGFPAFTPEGNLTLPLRGILQGVPTWASLPVWEVALGVLALVALAAALVLPLLSDRSWTRFLAWPWVALGVSSSSLVWMFGNNAGRVLAPPLLAFAALSFPNAKRQERVWEEE